MNGKDQFRYVAGADAKAMYAMRSLGKKRSARRWLSSFFGDAPKAA
jgi:hypothetical protein